MSAATTLVRQPDVPGLVLAVTSADGPVHAEAHGFADLAAARPVTVDTRFPWFSMTKIATATAAMRLADEGRLDLDAPVREYVPGYASAGGRPEPRVRQLLDHTAGAPNPLPLRWVVPAGAPTREVTAGVLRKHGRPGRRVGGSARYSNVGYLVLAEAVAAAAGRPFADVVRDTVLAPAGMRHTGFDHAGGADHATGYVRLPRPAVPLLKAALPAGIVGPRHGRWQSLRPFQVAGAGYGGLIGDAVDAARLLRLHLADGEVDGHRVLAADTARRMRRIATPGRRFDFGLGWFRPHGADADYVEHWGTGGGFWNAMRLYPGLGLGVVVMANTTRPYDHDAVMRAAVRAVSGWSRARRRPPRCGTASRPSPDRRRRPAG
jgi:CubicO group peptidase (beta-lactamase class C family)